MTDLLRAAVVAIVAASLSCLAVRSCSAPPPTMPDNTDIEQQRRALAADADRRIDEAWQEAQRLRELELYARLDALVLPPAPTAKPSILRAAARGQAAAAPTAESAAAPDPDRCAPLGNGWSRCPESVLDRLTLRLVDADATAATLTVRLDAERADRDLERQEWARERKVLAAAARPAPAWKVPAAIVGGAAVATGIALGLAGEERVGAAVGIGGLVVSGVALVW